MNAEKEVTAVLKRLVTAGTHLVAMSVAVMRVTHGQKMNPTARVNHSIPFLEVLLYGHNTPWGMRFVCCPEVRSCLYLGGRNVQKITTLGIVGFRQFIHSAKVVCFSKCPLIVRSTVYL